MNPELLFEGAVGGLVLVLVASAFGRFRSLILAAVLILAAGAYVSFAVQRDAGPSWLILELFGVALYGAFAVAGLLGSRWWLVAGWALHPVWDLALHYFGPGHAFAPESYTVACLSWDLLVAAAIASALLARRVAPGIKPTRFAQFGA